MPQDFAQFAQESSHGHLTLGILLLRMNHPMAILSGGLAPHSAM